MGWNSDEVCPRARAAELGRLVGQTVTFTGRVIRKDVGPTPTLVMESAGGGEVHVQVPNMLQANLGDILDFKARVLGPQQLYLEDAVGKVAKLDRDMNLDLLGDVIAMTWVAKLQDLFGSRADR